MISTYSDYLGENEHTKEQVAIKIEFDANNDIKTQGVTFEVACYEKLNGKIKFYKFCHMKKACMHRV